MGLLSHEEKKKKKKVKTLDRTYGYLWTSQNLLPQFHTTKQQCQPKYYLPFMRFDYMRRFI